MLRRRTGGEGEELRPLGLGGCWAKAAQVGWWPWGMVELGLEAWEGGEGRLGLSLLIKEREGKKIESKNEKR